jgi:hypothetical protein
MSGEIGWFGLPFRGENMEGNRSGTVPSKFVAFPNTLPSNCS